MGGTDQEEMLRWQGRASEHRTAVNSHFLTYAAALLGFQTATVMGSAPVSHGLLFVAAGCLALSSLVLGSTVVLMRLSDARLHARIARFRVEGESGSAIAELRHRLNRVGAWTNRLLPGQVVCFALGAAAFVAWLFLSVWGRVELAL